MTLYEINAQLEQAFLDCIDPETGEITGETDALDALTIARDEKVENVALYIKNLNAEADAIKAEADKLTARYRTAKNHAERLKNYLMGNLDGEKFKTPRVSISWRRTKSVQINDIDKLPDDCLRFKDPEPDKRLIKLALEEGRPIEGAELVENASMIIK